MKAWAEADACLPPDAKLDEDAYLISRGVRALALVGHCPDDPAVRLRVRTRLSTATQRYDSLVFIVPDGLPGSVAFGYASHAWAVALFEWALSDQVPPTRKHEILGLLLGYSAEAIARHQERDSAWPKCEDPVPGQDGDTL